MSGKTHYLKLYYLLPEDYFIGFKYPIRIFESQNSIDGSYLRDYVGVPRLGASVHHYLLRLNNAGKLYPQKKSSSTV